MALKLQKISREQVKMRLGLSGPSGFGKTYSALLLASGMTTWDKIAIIDTENKSAGLYSHLGEFYTIPLEAPYTPERYIEAIKACEDGGIEVIIIDSISHEWDGKGGCLEIVDKLGGRFTDWAKVTPRHTAFVQAITHCKCHILTTVRKKQEYALDSKDNGFKVTKLGMKEITREGFEYELTINFELINDKHLAKVGKDRTGLFDGKPEFLITPETGSTILDWCNSGAVVIPLYKQFSDRIKSSASADDLVKVQTDIKESNLSEDDLKKLREEYKTKLEDLTKPNKESAKKEDFKRPTPEELKKLSTAMHNELKVCTDVEALNKAWEGIQKNPKFNLLALETRESLEFEKDSVLKDIAPDSNTKLTDIKKETKK